MLLGVDLSHHQDPDQIDWQKFAQSGVKFAYIRATYGVNLDTDFLKHIENARQAGILTGAYHFLRFKSSQPAEAQAEAFLEALEPLAPHANEFLPPMLDLEDNSFDDQIKTADDRRRYVSLATSWLKTVEQRLGRLAGIYTRASFFDNDMGSPPGFDARPLWVAHYTSKPAPTIPKAWSRHHFWQFTESGQLPGFTKPLDLNRFEGDVEDLQDLARDHAFTDGPVADPSREMVAPALGSGLAAAALPVMRVANKGLSLRSGPKVVDATFMVSLPLGHRVEVLQSGIAGENGITWARVRTFVNNVQQTGFMSQAYLRRVSHPSVETLVDAAVAEWRRFKMGAGKENMAPYAGYVGEMWRDLDPASPLTGKDRGWYWSAAAISYFVKRAGPEYAAFKRSSLHSTFIHDAIVKREAETPAPFWGYRLNEQPLAVGDIVAQDRNADPAITLNYDYARTHASFGSHTDVVVGIYGSVAITLGGNVSDSVSTKEWSLTADGKLVPGKGLFAVLKNMAP
jgi:GH25 family lysozyme M1 (1,4-beta-N-acetylmuramidase)